MSDHGELIFKIDDAVKIDETVFIQPQSMTCPCGGGQSCIVERRLAPAFVLEDEVFKVAKLPVRENCSVEHSAKQTIAIESFKEKLGKPNSIFFCSDR